MKFEKQDRESQWKEEIIQVKNLGDKIGYGNMMDIASCLWSILLEDNSGIINGSHVSTVYACMLKKEVKIKKASQNEKIKYIRELLK